MPNQDLLFHAYKPPPFNGDKEEWYKWSHLFIAGAKIKKYAQAMISLDDFNIKKEVSDNPNDSHVLDMEYKDNQLRYDLMSFMEDNVNFNHIVACDTGQEAWLHLRSKYEEGSAHARIELKKSLLERKLNINEDPDLWISELEQTRSRLESQFKEAMEDNEFKILIMSGLNKSYDQLKGNLEYQFTDDEPSLTIRSRPLRETSSVRQRMPCRPPKERVALLTMVEMQFYPPPEHIKRRLISTLHHRHHAVAHPLCPHVAIFCCADS